MKKGPNFKLLWTGPGGGELTCQLVGKMKVAKN